MLNKKVKYLLSYILAFSIFTSSSFAIDIFIDNKQLQTDVEPQLINGRTLVPMRTIFESLGADIEWNNESRTVFATKGNITIELPIGSNIAKVNNQEFELDEPTMIFESRTMVPARFIAETLGMNVSWDQTTHTVLINSGPLFQQARVEEVIDANTIKIRLDDTEEIVKFIGINVSDDPNAYNLVHELLNNTVVSLEYDTIKKNEKGELLAYVWANGKMVNSTLLEKGYAVVLNDASGLKHYNEFYNLQK